MSVVKYKIKDVATDFGVAPKVIMEIISKFYEKPKSNSQTLGDEELNVLFDYITQTNQLDSIEQVFAVQPAPKAEPAKEAPKAEAAAPVKEAAPKNDAKPVKEEKPAKPAEPERKRERRVVDTSAVQVNSARFDDRAVSTV